MKLGIIGDTHYTNRGPSKRLDDFFATQLLKTTEALGIFQEQECDHVFQVGDLFDSHSVANRVKAAIISLLKQKHTTLLCIAGQHDIVGHSLGTLPNSPLSVLQAADVVQLLDETQVLIHNFGKTPAPKKAYCYGASFGSEIPIPKDPSVFNILVIHTMIGDKELYPGQKLTSPTRFLKNNPDYSLVLAGDYHYSFEATYEGRTIINPGCLVRKTISTFDLEHKPSVVVYNMETDKAEWFPLTIVSSDEVFDLSKSTIQNSFDIEKFLYSLKRKIGGPKSSTHWSKYLPKMLKKRKSGPGVIKLIDDCMEEVRS